MRLFLWMLCGIDSDLAPVDDEWDWEAFLDATKEGKLAMKKWARKNGCPWRSSLCLEVARHIEVFQWLKMIGLQTGIETPVRRVWNNFRLVNFCVV